MDHVCQNEEDLMAKFVAAEQFDKWLQDYGTELVSQVMVQTALGFTDALHNLDGTPDMKAGAEVMILSLIDTASLIKGGALWKS